MKESGMEYPIIGMSPGNSYFTQAAISKLVNKIVSEYGHAAVFIADVPAISTYVAVGYSSSEARSKAILKSNNLKNKVARVCQKLNYGEKQVRVIDWKNEIEDNDNYKESFLAIQKLFRDNPTFREACLTATKSVLENSATQITNHERSTETGVHYLLSELAFLDYAPRFLNTKKVAYIYHRDWPIFERYIAGQFDGKVKSELAFWKIRPQVDEP